MRLPVKKRQTQNKTNKASEKLVNEQNKSKIVWINGKMKVFYIHRELWLFVCKSHATTKIRRTHIKWDPFRFGVNFTIAISVLRCEKVVSENGKRFLVV